MKKLQGLLIIVILLLLSSCNPQITTHISTTYPPLNYKQKVIVIELDQLEPDNAEVLGQIKIGDTGFTTNCSYSIVIDKAKLEARKAGGNAIKITEHRLPTVLGSTCHRIKATILIIENTEN